MDSLSTGRMNIVCQVAPNFLFRLSVRHVGRMNTQVRLLNVGSMRNMGRMIRELYAIFTVQFNIQSRNISKMSYLVYFLNTYTLLRTLHCLHKLLFVRIAESFEITLLLLLSKSCHLGCASKNNPIKIVPAVTCISLSIKFVDFRRR